MLAATGQDDRHLGVQARDGAKPIQLFHDHGEAVLAQLDTRQQIDPHGAKAVRRVRNRKAVENSGDPVPNHGWHQAPEWHAIGAAACRIPRRFDHVHSFIHLGRKVDEVTRIVGQVAVHEHDVGKSALVS